ncbi:MAG TPA: SDR family oxidoreductase [Candidatus Krumholzibacteriaceae bacterium]|nr:SDR family oxidoreductase [Candidatus Krumholzibacteriaceae bacterium]
MKKHKDKKALITGGSRGIGLAIALRLASEGADIAINFRKDVKAASKAAEEIEKLGQNAFLIKADISNHKEIRSMFSKLSERFGSLDYFVSNAVSGVLGPAERIGRLGWKKALDTNARAFMLCCQETIKQFGDSMKAIVAISSIGGQTVLPGYTAVGASKAALESLVRYFGRELAPRGINVNAVSGGPVDTASLDYFPEKERIIEEWKNRTPSGRIGKPEDIAPVVSFLLSREAGWIQGQTIIIDGGLTL